MKPGRIWPNSPLLNDHISTIVTELLFTD